VPVVETVAVASAGAASLIDQLLSAALALRRPKTMRTLPFRIGWISDRRRGRRHASARVRRILDAASATASRCAVALARERWMRW
jgi:hypothetical protein